MSSKIHPDDIRPIVDVNKDQTISHMHRTLRKQRNPELFIGISDDLINMPSFRPSREVQARFEEVFDRDQRENLKIILHPWFRRFTIMERTWHKGQPLWQPVCMYQDDPVEGTVPPDLLEVWGKGAEHLRGKIGRFRNVSYQDLEFVEKCDIRKYGVEGVLNFISQFDDKAQEDAQKYMDDYLDDFMDYHFWLAMRDAQDHYSQPWSTRDVSLKSDPSRWKTEEVIGASGKPIQVRTRVWGEEGDKNEFKAFMEGDEHYDLSASGRAATRILEIKNERYARSHGKSLWEMVTGQDATLMQIQDSVAFDKENKDQAEKLDKFVRSQELPEEAINLDEWLVSLKDKVPVG